MPAGKGVTASIAVAGLLVVGAAVASSATATADPAPPPPADPAAPGPLPDASPPDPAAPPPTALGTMGAILNQGQPTGANPTGFDLGLTQTPIPALPGTQPSSMPAGALNAGQYLFGPNMKLAEQGQQSMYSAGPTDMNAPPASGRIDAIQRAHGLWHMGIGQMPQDQLGQPLPGTAPPPGTNIPQGLGQDSPDQPPAPGLLPIPAPPGG
jgi:hypothetical protein